MGDTLIPQESKMESDADKNKNNRTLRPSACLSKEEMEALLGPDLEGQKFDGISKASILAALTMAIVLGSVLLKFNLLSSEPEMPKLPPPQIAAAYTAMKNGFYNESLDLLGQAAAAKDVDLAMVDRLRAQALLGRAGRQSVESPEAAVSDLVSAAELAPDWSEVYLQTGRVLTRLKRLEEALVYYRKALTLDPKLDTAWFNSGYIHLKANDSGWPLKPFKK